MNDVFSFEITQGGGPPAGNYKAKFVGVEQHDHEQYGPGLRWKWEITEGPQAGVIASRITSPNPTTGNAAGKLIAGMTGQTLAGGQNISVKECVGQPFMLSVQQTKSGSGTRVESAMPID